MTGSRGPLEAVVFDAGGTLVRLDFEWMAETVSAHGTPVDAAAVRRAEVEGRRRYDASQRLGNDETAPLGRSGDVRAYFGGTLAAAGVPPSTIEALVDDFLAREKSAGLWSRPMEGAREALDGVARLGLRRAVVSNSDGRAEWHLKYSQVHEGVEFVVDSFLVGVEKPDPAIFHIALQRLGRRAGAGALRGRHPLRRRTRIARRGNALRTDRSLGRLRRARFGRDPFDRGSAGLDRGPLRRPASGGGARPLGGRRMTC
jgi:putative hydrolase of the HAD superfamily